MDSDPFGIISNKVPTKMSIAFYVYFILVNEK